MTQKLHIKTWGCQMNEYDSSKMADLLLTTHGLELTDIPEEADVLLLNTCSIREKAQEKVFHQLGRWKELKKQNPNLVIGVGGCVASQEGEHIRHRAPYVDIVFGPQTLHRLPEMINQIRGGKSSVVDVSFPEIEKFDRLPEPRAEGPTAFVSIMEGCNNFCTYCIVPYTRGRERSRKPELILSEIKKALSEGFKEITLLGQNVDSYGKGLEGDWNLSKLLREVNALEGNFRIRFVTSYPTDITEELIDTVIELDKVCEYFHIPMQSGDDYVLKKMNRRYDYATYKKICDNLRKRIPDVTITSDFIAGFPGETEEQFQNTLKAMSELELDYSNTAAYSPREKTVAAKWVDLYIPEDVKTERLARLNEHNRLCCLKSNQKYVGREMEVLIEKKEIRNGKGVITGRTRNNKIVHIPYEKDLTGEFVNVKITRARTWYLNGEMIG